jgi:hypothetical protein
VGVRQVAMYVERNRVRVDSQGHGILLSISFCRHSNCGELKDRLLHKSVLPVCPALARQTTPAQQRGFHVLPLWGAASNSGFVNISQKNKLFLMKNHPQMGYRLSGATPRTLGKFGVRFV